MYRGIKKGWGLLYTEASAGHVISPTVPARPPDYRVFWVFFLNFFSSLSLSLLIFYHFLSLPARQMRVNALEPNLKVPARGDKRGNLWAEFWGPGATRCLQLYVSDT